MSMLSRFATFGGGGDPYFYDVTLLLNGDGINGAQNNTFLDSSTNNFTITRYGDTTQGTFSPYGSGWSNYFDGNGDYLTLPSNTGYNFGTGDFTVEFWIYYNSVAGIKTVYDSNYGTAPNLTFQQADGVMNVYLNGVSIILTSSVTDITSTWIHYACVRSGTALVLYRNGSSVATGTYSGNVGSSSYATNIGGSTQGGGYYVNGNISNLRIVKGTALYTSNFTPPTSPLTAVSGTSLLTCQSNRFIDNSTNNATITANGTPSVQRFNPFNPSIPYVSSSIGGSGCFDGSGDYLSAGSNAVFSFGTGDFTAEAWIYLFSYPSSGVRGIIDTGNAVDSGRFSITVYSNGYIYVDNNTNLLISSSQLPLNQWVHIAISRSSGTMKMFFNGAQVASGSITTNFSDTNLRVGATIDNYYWYGYISNVRMVKGTAVYTASFTPPTSPVTAIANTSLLCNFINAGIYDSAMMNDLVTVGNAQISTSVKKFGTGSMYFDGTGDYLTIPSSVDFNFGSGDFTIEFWLNLSNLNIAALIDFRPNSVYLFVEANGVLSYGNTTFNINSGNNALSANIWTHIAVTRSSNTVKLYINGGQVGTNTDSSNYSTNPPGFIGVRYVSAAGNFYYLNGYIDDLRITKGIARYTSNFTPPTSPFPTY